MQSLDIVCQSFKLTLSSHWLLQKHLDSLQSFSLVIELSADDLVVQLSVLSGLVSEIFEHLVRSKVLVVNLLSVHKSLLDGQDLLLVELDHVGQLSFLFVELGILLLLFSELRSRLQQSLEVLLVALVFEQVDLGQELLFLLLQLCDFFLQLSWVHAFVPHLIDVLVCCDELSLQVFIDLEGLVHVIISQELVWDLERHKEFGGLTSSLELWKLGDDPEEEMLNSLLLTVHDISLELRGEVAWVAHNFQEPADSLLSLVLGFPLDVDCQMCFIDVSQQLIQ